MASKTTTALRTKSLPAVVRQVRTLRREVESFRLGANLHAVRRADMQVDFPEGDPESETPYPVDTLSVTLLTDMGLAALLEGRDLSEVALNGVFIRMARNVNERCPNDKIWKHLMSGRAKAFSKATYATGEIWMDIAKGKTLATDTRCPVLWKLLREVGPAERANAVRAVLRLPGVAPSRMLRAETTEDDRVKQMTDLLWNAPEALVNPLSCKPDASAWDRIMARVLKVHHPDEYSWLGSDGRYYPHGLDAAVDEAQLAMHPHVTVLLRPEAANSRS